MGEEPVIEHCGKPLEFRLPTDQDIEKNGGHWLDYVPEEATCGVCKTYFQRKQGSAFAYKRLSLRGNRGNYLCTNCNTPVETKNVSHRILIGKPYRIHPLSITELVPYCPKCEGEPSKEGKPIKF